MEESLSSEKSRDDLRDGAGLGQSYNTESDSEEGRRRNKGYLMIALCVVIGLALPFIVFASLSFPALILAGYVTMIVFEIIGIFLGLVVGFTFSAKYFHGAGEEKKIEEGLREGAFKLKQGRSNGQHRDRKDSACLRSELADSHSAGKTIDLASTTSSTGNGGVVLQVETTGGERGVSGVEEDGSSGKQGGCLEIEQEANPQGLVEKVGQPEAPSGEVVTAEKSLLETEPHAFPKRAIANDGDTEEGERDVEGDGSSGKQGVYPVIEQNTNPEAAFTQEQMEKIKQLPLKFYELIKKHPDFSLRDYFNADNPKAYFKSMGRIFVELFELCLKEKRSEQERTQRAEEDVLFFIRSQVKGLFSSQGVTCGDGEKAQTQPTAVIGDRDFNTPSNPSV